MLSMAEGEDALIVAHEGDHYVVVAGTFEKLVEQLACEEKPGIHTCTHICTHTHTHTHAHTHTPATYSIHKGIFSFLLQMLVL